jgi:hypothetical protein
MKRMLYGQDDMVAGWVAQQIGGAVFASDARAIGLLSADGERLVAGMVWDNFTPWDCTCAVAGDGTRQWMSREFLFRSFAYPFLQLGLRRMTALIAEDNADSIRLCQHIGFTPEGRRREGRGDCDELVFGLLRRECRWIGANFIRRAAAAESRRVAA